MRSPREELTQPNFEDFAQEFFESETSAPWYIAVRAVENFRENHHGRYPGMTESQIETDFPALRAEFDAILDKVREHGGEEIKVDDKYVREMIRFSDA